MVTGSSPLKAIGGFAWLLTSGSYGISRGVRKLAQTSIVIKKIIIGGIYLPLNNMIVRHRL